MIDKLFNLFTNQPETELKKKRKSINGDTNGILPHKGLIDIDKEIDLGFPTEYLKVRIIG
jgi:hypothetical protein